jgi:hypothetical protein
MIDKVQEPPDKENDQEFIKLSGTICQVYKKSFIFNSSGDVRIVYRILESN